MEKMLLEIVLIVVGIAVVLWGADRFTDGASGLARRLKVSELVIGLTVVALGTSLPEFMVSFMSVLRGSSDMSVGNILGSNIFNILVILGASAIMRPMVVEKTLLRRDLPLCFAASVLLVLFALTGGTIARWEGLLLVAFFCAYLFVAYRIAVKDRKGAQDEVREESAPLMKLVLLILLGMVALVIGGRVLVDNAASVAHELGVSESVIGMTILAAGTSLPEFATSVLAARKGSLGLAFGNAIGSNVFNIAFVVGTCGSIVPMVVTEITAIDWCVLVGSVVLVWLVAFTRRTINAWEGSLLVLCYLSYLISLLVG
jgi:cation:H+ antiporter